jgi:tetratricopeptide (TPR) repeat protein
VPDSWKSAVEAGNAAFADGKVAQAETHFLEAASQAEAFGQRDPRLSLSLNNLAAIYQRQGKFTMAEPLYLRSLDIKRQHHAGDHQEVALNLHNLAVLYSARRLYPVAEKYYKETLEMKERLFGKEHPELLNTLKYYAQLMKVLNRPIDMKLLESRMAEISAKSDSP